MPPTESVLDLDGSNPFWPKNMAQPGGPDTPASDRIQFADVKFGTPDPAVVTVDVTTTPAGSAWTINWGDGTTDPIAAGTLTATHTYTDKTAGKQYTIVVTSGSDSDSRNIQY
jgi:Flp pilus assembly protein TadG